MKHPHQRVKFLTDFNSSNLLCLFISRTVIIDLPFIDKHEHFSLCSRFPPLKAFNHDYDKYTTLWEIKSTWNAFTVHVIYAVGCQPTKLSWIIS